MLKIAIILLLTKIYVGNKSRSYLIRSKSELEAKHKVKSESVNFGLYNKWNYSVEQMNKTM